MVYSEGIIGEHATTIAGEGKNPTKEHMLSVAETVGMNCRQGEQIISKAQTGIEDFYGNEYE